jgi:hypothetical protein
MVCSIINPNENMTICIQMILILLGDVDDYYSIIFSLTRRFLGEDIMIIWSLVEK